MRVGDRLFVFEKTFYQNLLKTVQGEFEPDGTYAESDLQEGLLRGDGQTLVETDQSMALLQQQNYRHAQEKEKLAFVVEVLSSADVIRIELDDEIIGFLPFYDVMTLGDVVDILGGLPANLSTELAFLTEYRTSQLPTAVNLGAADFIRLKPKQTVHFMTEPTYKDILDSYNSPKSTPLLDMARQTELASIYVDGRLVLLIAPHKFLNASEYFSRMIARGLQFTRSTQTYCASETVVMAGALTRSFQVNCLINKDSLSSNLQTVWIFTPRNLYAQI